MAVLYPEGGYGIYSKRVPTSRAAVSSDKHSLHGMRYYLDTFIASPAEFTEENRKVLKDHQVEFLHIVAPILMFQDRPIVLDIGTGAGRIPAALLDCFLQCPDERDGRATVVPFDLSKIAMFRVCTAFGIPGVVGTAEALPFADRSFTGAVLSQVLEFTLKEARQNLAIEAARVIAPGGSLCIMGLEAFALEAYSKDHRFARELSMVCPPHLSLTEMFRLFPKSRFSLIHHEHVSCIVEGDTYVLIFRRLS